MKTRQSRRQTAKVSHSRWLAYATAGAATALVSSHSAEAAIHYSGLVEVKFPPIRDMVKTFQLDQPGDSFRLVLSHILVMRMPTSIFQGPTSDGFQGTHLRFLSVSFKIEFRPEDIDGFLYFDTRFAVRDTWRPLADVASGGILASASSVLGSITARASNMGGHGSEWPGAAAQWLRADDYAYADPGEPIRAGAETEGKYEC